MLRTVSLSAVIVFALIATSGATPVTYDEAVSGDLPGFGNPLTTFTLDVGANTVKGTRSATDVAETFADSFAFIIPAGLRVTGGSIETSNAVVITSVDWDLRAGSAGRDLGTLLNHFYVDCPGSQPIDALLPGLYNFSSQGGSTPPFAPFPQSTDYLFTLNVAPIPEPASLSLLALTGVALLRRRR